MKPTAIFCSQVCRWRFNGSAKPHQKKKILCRSCGTGFFSQVRGVRYCSDDCRKVNKPEEHQKICSVCRNEFKTTISSQKTCSSVCKRKWKNRSKRIAGMISRVGKTPCESCGFSNLKAIHRHHINPLSGNGGGVMCLCANCHYIFHGVVGQSLDSENRTREDVLEVIKKDMSPFFQAA
jgi:hypothetical protein